MKRKLQLLLIGLISVSCIYAQNIDSAYVRVQNEKVGKLNRAGNFDEAYKICQDLLTELRIQNAPQELFGKTYYSLSNVQISQGNYEESIATAHKSLRIFKDLKDSLKIASALNRIGVGYYFLYDYDSTKYYYEKSYALKKNLGASAEEMAVSSYNLAIAYEDLGKTEKALELYLEAEQYLLQNPDKLSFLSDVYVGLTHLYNFNQEVNKAEYYAEKAMDVGIKSYGELNPNMTFVYAIYGNVLTSRKKYKKAIGLLEKTLQIRRNTYGEVHKWTCEAHYDLARILALDDQLDLAESHLLQAIEIGKKTKSLPNLAMAQTTLAKLYVNNDLKPERVKTLLESSTEIYDGIYGPKNLLSAENYLYKAIFAKNQKEDKQFFQAIEQVYQASNYIDKNLNQTYTPFEVLEALHLEGEWLIEKFEKTNNDEYLLRRLELLDEQLELVQFSKNNFTSESAKILFSNDYHKVFDGGLYACWLLYEKTGSKDYIEKAFRLSELNRNSVLLEEFTEEKLRKFSGIPEDLSAKEDNFKKELNEINLEIYEIQKNSEGQEGLSDLLTRRLVINQKLDSLQKDFQQNYTDYSVLQFKSQQFSLKNAQDNLPSNTQWLIYFLGEENLFTLNITKEHADFFASKEAETIVEMVDTFQQKMISITDLKQESKFLFENLCQNKFNLNKENVVIIPDQQLNYIPFEVLIDERDQYFIENFSISYAGSSRLYFEMHNNYFDYTSPNYWAGFSPDYQEGNELYGSQREVENIANLVNGKGFFGEDSSKENFLKNTQNFSILHLAMHGEVDEEIALRNKLWFGEEALTASEISVADIKANLAVLSACNTGFGKLEKGEGVMSLARSFHFAGVPSILMSLWKVPDNETEQIMVFFYKYLVEGMSKSESLKRAKMDYLLNTKETHFKHPFYWSGFVVTGNTATLKQEKNNSWYILGGITLGLFVILGYRKFKS